MCNKQNLENQNIDGISAVRARVKMTFCSSIIIYSHIFCIDRMHIIFFLYLYPRTFKLKYQFAVCVFLQGNCVPLMVSTQETLHRAPCCISNISTLWSSSIWYDSSLFQTASDMLQPQHITEKVDSP